MYLTWSRRSSDSPRSCSRGPASGRETRGWGGGQGGRDREAGSSSPLLSDLPSSGRKVWSPLLSFEGVTLAGHYLLVMFCNLLTVTSCITPESLSHRLSPCNPITPLAQFHGKEVFPVSSLTCFIVALKKTGRLVLAGIIPSNYLSSEEGNEEFSHSVLSWQEWEIGFSITINI